LSSLINSLYLDFDSHLFSLNVNSMYVSGTEPLELIEQVIEECKFELLYLISDKPLDLKVLKENPLFRITYVDEKVVFEKQLKVETTQKLSSNIKINSWMRDDIEQLESLAISSGEFSRFFLDNKIPNDKAKELYLIWLNRSLSFEIADEIYITRKDKPTGLLTVKFLDNKAKVGLLAVDEHSRGQGIAKQLLVQLEHNCLEKGIDVISIPTQRVNENACEFYEKAGFSEINSSFIYHFWKFHG
jgi:dTDP-4-amino-4,6-dideoxy-D-galactose acyltransferase